MPPLNLLKQRDRVFGFFPDFIHNLLRLIRLTIRAFVTAVTSHKRSSAYIKDPRPDVIDKLLTGSGYTQKTPPHNSKIVIMPCLHSYMEAWRDFFRRAFDLRKSAMLKLFSMRFWIASWQFSRRR
jgi:hypothetical protein